MNPPVLADVILVAIPVAKTAAEEAVPILAKVVVKAPPNNSSDHSYGHDILPDRQT